jgi:hypothetical protein
MALSYYLATYKQSLTNQVPVEPFHIQLRFVGRAQRLLTEACTKPNAISSSSPDNSPELMAKISDLIRSALINDSIITTPVTRNTTPTANISSTQSPLISLSDSLPTEDPTSPQVMFRARDGTIAYSKPLDVDPLTTCSNPSTSTPMNSASTPPALHQLPTQQVENKPKQVENNPIQVEDKPTSQDVRLQQPHNTVRNAPTTAPNLPSHGSSFHPPATTTNSTPPWDSHDRDGYNYFKNPRDYLRSLPTQPVMFSNTWTHARFDLTRIEEVLDPKTGLFLSWFAPRPDYGNVECFPLRLNALFMIKDYFLKSFQTGLSSVGYNRLDPKLIRAFQDAFPIFGSEDANNFLFWHNRVVEFGLCFGVYIPPAHTLRDGQPLGIWFDSLTPCVQLMSNTISSS